MNRCRPLILILLLAPSLAQAAGPIGVEIWGGGGARRSFQDYTTLDFSVGLDVRLTFIMLGGEFRFTPPVSSINRLQGMFNLTLLVPGQFVRPYLQLSAGGGALFTPDAWSNGAARQAIGMDFFIKKLGLGFKIFLDEQMSAATKLDLGVGGQFVLRYRGG